ncbi:OmpA family protein, partial [Sphingobium sp. UBA5915]
RPMADGVEIRAADLFLPGEALLSARGEAQIAALARRFASAPAVEIRSHGADARHERFDEWDLAAARLGAVARALQARGLVRDRLLIRG